MSKWYKTDLIHSYYSATRQQRVIIYTLSLAWMEQNYLSFVQARNRPSMDGIKFLLRNTNQVYSKRCQQQFRHENKKQVSTFPSFPAEWQLCTQRVNQRLSQQHPPRIRKQNKTPKLLRQQIVAHVIRNRCAVSAGPEGATVLQRSGRGSRPGVAQHPSRSSTDF